MLKPITCGIRPLCSMQWQDEYEELMEYGEQQGMQDNGAAQPAERHQRPYRRGGRGPRGTYHPYQQTPFVRPPIWCLTANLLDPGTDEGREQLRTQFHDLHWCQSVKHSWIGEPPRHTNRMCRHQRWRLDMPTQPPDSLILCLPPELQSRARPAECVGAAETPVAVPAAAPEAAPAAETAGLSLLANPTAAAPSSALMAVPSMQQPNPNLGINPVLQEPGSSCFIFNNPGDHLVASQHASARVNSFMCASVGFPLT